MPKPARKERFADIYRAWMAHLDIDSQVAAVRLGVSQAVSYRYARGDSVPTTPRLGPIAALMGIPLPVLAEVVDRDRRRMQQARDRVARQATEIGHRDQLQQVIGADDQVQSHGMPPEPKHANV